MAVVRSPDFDQLVRLANYPAKDLVYFRFNNGIEVERPPETLLISSEAIRPPVCKHNPSSFLLTWGCGEFGQHGHDAIKGDLVLSRSLTEHDSGRLLLKDETPTFVACGSSHTLVLSENGKLYSWGNGTSGQLGNGTSETVCKPTPVSLGMGKSIQGMACGARHSFIWMADGHCFSFGNNFNAQLGYNFSKADFKENQLQPVLVELLPHMMVKQVACGARHTLFLLTTGYVLAVGCNQHGQIGNGTTDDVVIPTKLEDLSTISHIACGNSHSLASDEESGQLYAWGYGKALGTKTRQVVSPKSFNLHGKDSRSGVLSLAGGDSHSMVLYQDGILYTWGNNYEGQLGLGKPTKYQSEPEPIPNSVLPRPVVQMSCSETTCAAVTREGKLYMWGKNAGVIHSDKPSQYFQFEPYHIDTDSKLVTQVSCGAWHVSAVVRNSTALNNNINTQKIETSKSDLDEEISFIQPSSVNHFRSESYGVLRTGHLNVTKEAFADNAELPSWAPVYPCEEVKREQGLAIAYNLLETTCNNLNFDEKRSDADLTTNNYEEPSSCRVTRYEDNNRTLSTSSNACDENRQPVDHSNNEFRETDSLNQNQSNLQETAEEFCKQETIQENCHGTINYNNAPDSGIVNNIQNYRGMSQSITTDVFHPQSKTSEGFKSKVEETVESSKEPINNIDHATFNRSVCGLRTVQGLGNSKGRNQLGTTIAEDTQNGKSLGFKTEQEEIVKSTLQESSQNHSIASDDTINLGAGNDTHNTYQCNNVLTKYTLSNKSGEFNETKDFLQAHQNVKNISVWHNSGMKQHKRVFRQTSTLPSSKVVDANTFSQKQAMPVINLSFGSSAETIPTSNGYQQMKPKPSLFSIRNMWNSPNLLREKQGKKMLTRHTRSDVEIESVLESMLPNRPTHTVTEIKKWAKFKDSSTACVESTRQVPKHSVICNHSGKLLPPICSCKSRMIDVSLRQQQTSTCRDVFIDRR